MRGGLRSADGFSLIELLIAIAVLGVILPALGTAFYVSARTVDGTTDRVTSSAATTLATADFGRDIQSALTVSTGSVATCGPVPGTALFTVTRSDGIVTWFSSGDAIGRHACLGTTSTTTLPVELDSAPTITCLPLACTAAASQPTSVSFAFSPVEGGPIELHATRRNP